MKKCLILTLLATLLLMSACLPNPDKVYTRNVRIVGIFPDSIFGLNVNRIYFADGIFLINFPKIGCGKSYPGVLAIGEVPLSYIDVPVVLRYRLINLDIKKHNQELPLIRIVSLK